MKVDLHAALNRLRSHYARARREMESCPEIVNLVALDALQDIAVSLSPSVISYAPLQRAVHLMLTLLRDSPGIQTYAGALLVYCHSVDVKMSEEVRDELLQAA